ncbi:hypothetical protein D3C81_1846960 [compost metagenome]
MAPPTRPPTTMPDATSVNSITRFCRGTNSVTSVATLGTIAPMAIPVKKRSASRLSTVVAWAVKYIRAAMTSEAVTSTGRRPTRSATEPRASEPINMPSMLILNTGPRSAFGMPQSAMRLGAA